MSEVEASNDSFNPDIDPSPRFITGKPKTLVNYGGTKGNERVIFSKHDILSGFAKYIVSQAGVKRASAVLGTALPEIDDYISQYNFDNNETLDTSLQVLDVMCSRIVKAVNSVRDLNLSQLELDASVKVDDPSRPSFSFASRYSADERRTDTNFTDLDALARNVVIDIWYDYQIAVG